MEVTPQRDHEVLSLPATVRAADSADLAFEVSGRVEGVAVKLGDRVSAGERLAWVDPEPFALELKQAQAELARAEAELPAAEAQYRRDRKLVKTGAGSARDLDLSRTAFESARATVALARAAVQQVQRRLRDTVLKAPYAGRIAGKLLEPGSYVTSGTSALRLVSDTGLELEALVPETRQGALELGSEHAARLVGLPGEHTARLSEISAEAWQGGAFTLRLVLEPSNAGIIPGMAAELDLKLPAESSIRLPLSALSAPNGNESPGRGHVFVFDPETACVVKRGVRLGRVSGDSVRVIEGLDGGEIVARRGVAFLEDGMAVTLLNRGVARFNP
ncbi:efflux RND transporter periplasmic adaptor subunit [Azotobacter armeniacus]